METGKIEIREGGLGWSLQVITQSVIQLQEDLEKLQKEVAELRQAQLRPKEEVDNG